MALKAQATVLCIGVQKAGTSWLYEMLCRRLEIGTGDPEEIHFFNRESSIRRGRDCYLSHFEHCCEAEAVDESCSTSI